MVQLTQPKGQVSKETNKESIARNFGCKKSEVTYDVAGQPLTGYKVIYEQLNQRSYPLPAGITGTVTSLFNGILVYSGGTIDLSSIALSRREFVVLPGDFSSGAVLVTKNEVLTFEGYRYRWGGVLPKTVPAGSTPDTSGGTSENTWINIDQEAVFNELSENTGASHIGYEYKHNNIDTTVSEAMDRIYQQVIYAEDFGVKVDNSDNEQALYDLSMYLSTQVTIPTKVVFPSGVSLVGSQKLAGATGLGYSYEPSYFSRSFPSIEGRGYLFISLTNVEILLDMQGWTLKRNNGSKLGSFDPVTGEAAPDQIGSSGLNFDYKADSGNLMILFKSPNVKVLGGTLDGNIQGTIWGGKWGDNGYQNHAYNIWLNQTGGVRFYNFKSVSSPVECVYIGETSSFNPDVFASYPLTLFEYCTFTDAGRNVVTVSGGANIEFKYTTMLRGGSLANNIGSHYSLPQSCVDIEAEGGNIYDIRFIKCYILDSSGDAFQTHPAPGTVKKILLKDCTVRSILGDFAIRLDDSTAGVIVEDCLIAGSVGTPSSTGREATTVRRCEINNTYGGSWSKNFTINGKFAHFDENRIFINIPTSPKINYPLFNIQAPDPVQYGLGIRSSCRDNYIEIWGGSSDDVTHVDLGGFLYYRDLTLYVSASNMTGTKVLPISCVDSNIGTNGVSTNSTKITFGAAMLKRPDVNVYYGVNKTGVSGNLAPVIDAQQSLGQAGSGFKEAWIKDSIKMYNNTGQLCQLHIVGTTWTVTPI